MTGAVGRAFCAPQGIRSSIAAGGCADNGFERHWVPGQARDDNVGRPDPHSGIPFPVVQAEAPESRTSIRHPGRSYVIPDWIWHPASYPGAIPDFIREGTQHLRFYRPGRRTGTRVLSQCHPGLDPGPSGLSQCHSGRRAGTQLLQSKSKVAGPGITSGVVRAQQLHRARMDVRGSPAAVESCPELLETARWVTWLTSCTWTSNGISNPSTVPRHFDRPRDRIA